MNNVIQWPLPTPDTVIYRHDLSLERGVYGYDVPRAYWYGILIVTSTGKIIARFCSKMEFAARGDAILADCYRALCELEPDPNKPELVAPIARFEITAAGRAALAAIRS